MLYFAKTLAVIAFLAILGLAGAYGLHKSEVNDCIRWQAYADSMPHWWATDDQKAQCDAMRLPLRLNL